MRHGRARPSTPARRRRGRRSPPNGAASPPASIPAGPEDEALARQASDVFTAYLRAARGDAYALSTLPPGRFLMPGDLEGSPALTFAPLPLPDGGEIAPGTLAAMMERRYEAYKTHVVRPFFRDHFARLDRQIVLVDALAALNSGPAALRDLQMRSTKCSRRSGSARGNALTKLFRPKIDKILVAATKADHLHHLSHDRLEAILRQLTARAIARAEFSGATVDVIALAAIRATREAARAARARNARRHRRRPARRRNARRRRCSTARPRRRSFPGNCPPIRARPFAATPWPLPEGESDYRFLRFRPPRPVFGADGKPLPAPHIRLDRACQFLFGDRLT